LGGAALTDFVLAAAVFLTAMSALPCSGGRGKEQRV
jgi:hypothetical protein